MAAKTFIVERGPQDKVEVQAERGEQDTGSSRVTFYNGEEAVGSFINIQAWYPKAK
jgi:hypothetical protein